jgi:phosphoribosylglycinamide formyltransferase 1
VKVLPVRAESPERWAIALDRALHAADVELVVLAGFLSVLPEGLVERWAGRIINVHPSLLPKYGGPGFYGHRVHAAVLAAGDRESGATVHVVTPEVDRGPIVAQARLPVAPDDTPESLRARLGPVERALLVETIGRFAAGALPLPYPGERRG